MSKNEIKTPWKKEHETILIDWADKAMCYRWLHEKANTMYSYRNAWFTIPVIIISTLTGTANFAQDRFPDDYKNSAVMAIGGFNILAGIITTIHQFLKISELNESHRVSSIAWGKFYRNIKVELAKSPDERMNVTNMIKLCKEEFDRLMETSPQIPDCIVDDFQNTFGKDKENTLQYDDVNNDIYYSNYNMISKPEICDQLVSTQKFRYIEKINVSDRYQDIVEKFVIEFNKIHGRPPLLDEIKDQYKKTINLIQLDNILNKLNIDDICNRNNSDVNTIDNEADNVDINIQDSTENISINMKKI